MPAVPWKDTLLKSLDKNSSVPFSKVSHVAESHRASQILCTFMHFHGVLQKLCSCVSNLSPAVLIDI